MAGLTRRELVLQLLRQHEGQWVDGTRIASAEVGGSEGLKRLRELRQEGLDIRMRKHPDPRRDIYQYRLVPRVIPTKAKAEWSADIERSTLDHTAFGPGSIERRIGYDGSSTTVIHDPPPTTTPGMMGRDFPLRKNEDGSVEIVWEVCDECGGRYAVRSDHLTAEEHRRWVALSQTMEGQTTIPEVASEPVYAYTEEPKGVSFGEAVVCPRCRGVRRPKRKRMVKGAYQWYKADEMCMDPRDHSIVCRRCNGWGLVPNRGPVETAKTPPPLPEEPVEEAPSTEAFTSE
jgi:hypothetical protein